MTATPSYRWSIWSSTGNGALNCREAAFGLLRGSIGAAFSLLRGSTGRLSGWVKGALYSTSGSVALLPASSTAEVLELRFHLMLILCSFDCSRRGESSLEMLCELVFS